MRRQLSTVATASVSRHKANAIPSRITSNSRLSPLEMADNYLQSLVNSSQPDKTDPSTLSTSDPLAIIKLIALQQQKQRHQQSRQMNSQDRGESSSINVDMAVIRGSAAEWPQYSLRAVRDFLRRPDAADFDDDLLDQAISSVCQAFGRLKNRKAIEEIKDYLLTTKSFVHQRSISTAAIHMLLLGEPSTSVSNLMDQPAIKPSPKFIGVYTNRMQLEPEEARRQFDKLLLEGGNPSTLSYSALIRSLSRCMSTADEAEKRIEQAWQYVRRAQELPATNALVYEALLELYVAANRIAPDRYSLDECRSKIWREMSEMSLGAPQMDRRKMYEILMYAYGTRRYPATGSSLMDDTNDNLAQCLRLKRELMTESIPLTAKMYHAMFFACHPGKVGRRLECNPAILSIEAEMQSIGIMHFPFTLATFINIAWAGGHYATCLQVMERERLLRGESNWIDIAPGVYRSIFRLASFGQLQTVQRSVELIRDRHLLAGIINRANSGDKRHRELIGLIKGCCERIGAYDLIHFLDTQR